MCDHGYILRNIEMSTPYRICIVSLMQFNRLEVISIRSSNRLNNGYRDTHNNCHMHLLSPYTINWTETYML